jgi:hypothetical protein
MRRRFLATVSAFIVSISPGAFAQSASHSQDQAGVSQDDVEHRHPNWYKEPKRYRPCPASVEFPNGRHACLGMLR